MEELFSLIVLTLSFLIPFLYLFRGAAKRAGSRPAGRPGTPPANRTAAPRAEVQSGQRPSARPSASDRLRELFEAVRDEARPSGSAGTGEQSAEEADTWPPPERPRPAPVVIEAAAQRSAEVVVERLMDRTAAMPMTGMPMSGLRTPLAAEAIQRESAILRIRRLPPLQQALVMAEVLGPPRALKEFPGER